MNRLRWALALIAIAALLAACGGGGVVKVSDKDAGASFDLAKGSTLELTLAGNPTTGYVWQVIASDETVLQQVGDYAYKADSNLTGAGGKLTFTFEPVKAGKVALKLGYLRTWENNPPIRTFEITVKVK